MESINDIKEFIRSISKCFYLQENLFHVNDDIVYHAVELFKCDYLRWYDEPIDVNRLYTTPQLIAMLCYRIARNIHCTTPYLRHQDNNGNSFNPYAADAYSLLGRHIGQIEIFYSSEIGKGLKINHGVGSVIGARCRIGDNCTIHQNCTLGDRNGGRPTIGDNVTIYAGSMILGNISIGDNTIIGANSVVTESCPANSVLVGTPARIIKRR